MDNSFTPGSGKSLLWIKTAKILFFYALVPLLFLILLAQPVGSAVRSSDQNIFLIFLAALGAVVLNWLVYAAIHRKRPTVLVAAHGLLCLLAVVIVENEALPGNHPLSAILVVAGCFLAFISLLLFSSWCASRRSRPAHAAAVTIRVILAILLCCMVYPIARDIETRSVNPDTWINIGGLVVLLLAFNGSLICSVFRRSAVRRKATGLVPGRIVQIIGETSLDLDGDPVTQNYARIRYTVDNVPYETRADISRFVTRLYGKEAFIDWVVPVCYDPADPGTAFVKRIDRHVFDP